MRASLRLVLLAWLVIALAACQAAPAPTPYVVEKVVERVVEKIITAKPPPTLPPVIEYVVVTATPKPVTPTPEPTAAPEPGSSLEVQGQASAETFGPDQLRALPLTEGWGGIKSSTGKITPPQRFKGVSLLDLCERMGACDDSVAIQVVAKDGYAMTFSYDQIAEGQFIAFNPATGEEITPKDHLTIVVAYERDGQPIPGEEEGPLRLAVLSDNKDQVTDGHWSVKWVRRVVLKPAIVEWTLHLEGVLTETMDRNTFESGASPNCHQAEWTDDEGQVWSGIPLFYLMGRVDDLNTHEGDAFDYDRAIEGYAVDVVSADGFKATFQSRPLIRNRDVILANLMNGEPLPEKHFPLRLVGPELTKKEMVSGVAQIVLDLPAASPAEMEAAAKAAAEAKAKGGHPGGMPAAEPTKAPEAKPAESPAVSMEPGVLHVYGKVNEPIAYAVARLQQMGLEKIEAEHPKKGKVTYEGVRLNELLAVNGLQADASVVVFTAGDGFASELPLADLAACADCLVALDGEGFALVMPGLPSNAWVKDVRLIEVK